ncbi:hypothetical protein ADK64_18600 [Streptomyces sp. MMG1121]|nr:hypothetical protein ADK64_18600 [Streptomyces sp. MMG1121]
MERRRGITIKSAVVSFPLDGVTVTGAPRRAGTAVRGPMRRFRLEAPADTLGAPLPVLAQPGGVPEATGAPGPAAAPHGTVPAARACEPERRLTGLPRGEGGLETAFGHCAPDLTS